MSVSLEAEIVLTSFIAYVFPASCTSYIAEDFEQLISLLMSISEGFIFKALCEPIFAEWATLSRKGATRDVLDVETADKAGDLIAPHFSNLNYGPHALICD